jgi:hypothetical protein
MAKLEGNMNTMLVFRSPRGRIETYIRCNAHAILDTFGMGRMLERKKTDLPCQICQRDH